MKHQLELNRIEIDIDYYDPEDVIKGFLTLSALNRIKEFNFKKAFENLIPQVKNKLAEHGQLDYESFEEIQLEFGSLSFVDLSDLCVSTDYIYITEDDIKKFIIKGKYEKFKETFAGYLGDLEDILSDYQNYSELNLKEKILLFDRVIHAEHVTGMIFDDVDIEDIKTDLDKELIEMMGIC